MSKLRRKLALSWPTETSKQKPKQNEKRRKKNKLEQKCNVLAMVHVYNRTGNDTVL